MKVIYDGPEAGIVNNNPLTGDLEWDLDTQISTHGPEERSSSSTSTTSRTFTDPEVARGINMFVSQDKATALSASLGECDYIAFLDGAMLTTDEALAEGALQGQSIVRLDGRQRLRLPRGRLERRARGSARRQLAGRRRVHDRGRRHDAARRLERQVQEQRSPGSAAAAASRLGRRLRRGRCRRTPPARPGSSPTRAAAASPTSPRWRTATRRTSSTAGTRPARTDRASAAPASPAR